MHVLIVDDEPLAQIALTNILADRREVEGFDPAKDTVEADHQLIRQSFDVLRYQYAGSLRYGTPRPTNSTWPSPTFRGFL